MKKVKELGQVFTPQYIVDNMLDEIGYIENNSAILHQKIIEPSFGAGVFLLEIINRFINAGYNANLSPSIISELLKENVYGIELDKEIYSSTISKIQNLLSINNIPNVELNNITNGNTLMVKYQKLKGKFDFVVGNPPYVRIRNMSSTERNRVKRFQFSTGTTDLYIVFFELGISLLKDNGILTYITPNSFLRNVSQRNFRKYIAENKYLFKLVDFGSKLIFSNASTYTAITYLSKSDNKSFTYIKNDDKNNLEKEIKWKENTDSTAAWNFSENSNSSNEVIPVLSDICIARQGALTMRDSIYVDASPVTIDDNYVLFNGKKIEASVLIPVVKASTYQGTDILSKIIFPYTIDASGKCSLITEEVFQDNFPLAYKYLLSHKKELLKRDSEKGCVWYGYGRSQGLRDIYSERIVIKNTLKSDATVKANVIPAGVVVYSGYYILPNDGEMGNCLNSLNSQAFTSHVLSQGKDLRGGYKSFGSKVVVSFPYTKGTVVYPV